MLCGKFHYSSDVKQRLLQPSCSLYSFTALVCCKEHRIGKVLARSSSCFSQSQPYFSFLIRLQSLQGRNFSACVTALRAPILHCCDQSSPKHFLPGHSGAVFQTFLQGCLCPIPWMCLRPALKVSCLPAYIIVLFPLLSLAPDSC